MSAAMKKRNLFAELAEGFDALAEERAGKRNLRTHEVEARPAPDVTAAELIALRERLNLSRPLLARYLRTNPRTLENLEQGRARLQGAGWPKIWFEGRYREIRAHAKRPPGG